MLSLNKHEQHESMKELEDPESIRDSDHIQKGVRCQRKEWVSEIWKSGLLRVRFFAWGFNAILRLCRVLRTAQSFFGSPCWKTWTVLIRLGCLGFAEAKLDLDSPWQHVQQRHKRGKCVVKTALMFLWELAFCLSWVSKRSGVVDFFCSEVEPLPGRARVIVLLLGIERTFAGLVVRTC